MLVDAIDAVKQRLFVPSELDLECLTLARVVSLSHASPNAASLRTLLPTGTFVQQSSNFIWPSATKLTD
jgi:hypothetical protein